MRIALLLLVGCAGPRVAVLASATVERCAELDRRGALGETERERCAHEEVRAGRDAQALGLPRLAMYRYQRALLYDPDLSSAHNAVGELLLDAADARRACDSFGRALARDPGNATARRNLSSCALELGQLRRAESLIDSCQGPWDLDCWCALGHDVVIGPFAAELPRGLDRELLANACPQMRTLAVERCERLLTAGDCNGAAAACHAALSAWPENRSARYSWRRAQACVVDEARDAAFGGLQPRQRAFEPLALVE